MRVMIKGRWRLAFALAVGFWGTIWLCRGSFQRHWPWQAALDATMAIAGGVGNNAHSGAPSGNQGGRDENKGGKDDNGTAGKAPLPQTGKAGNAQTTPEANELLREAKAALCRRRSITARIRHQANLYGKHQTGAGTYVQGLADQYQVRMEMKLPLGDGMATLQQICDGRFLWESRQFKGECIVSRIDVRKAVAAIEVNPSAHVLPTGFGGLPQVLDALDASFLFAVRENRQADEAGTYELDGHWRPEKVARLLPPTRPGDEPDLGKLPAVIPDHVVVVLDRDNLLPRRIEYRRTASEPRKSDDDAGPVLLLVLEVLEPHFDEPIPPELFEFDPGDQPVRDATDEFISNIERP